MSRFSHWFMVIFLSIFSSASAAENIDSVLNRLHYEGAFRLPVGTVGDSRLGWANGKIALNPFDDSFFVVGHAQHQSIAEFSIPTVVKSDSLTALNFAANIQPFVRTTNRVASGNPQGVGTITAMKVLDGQLIVNAAKYYDATAGNTDTTYIIENPADLAGSEVSGFYKLAARHHAAGWMSDVPVNLQQELGFEFIFGNASNLPINGRSSMGPSAFGVEKASLDNLTTGQIIDTLKMLDFSINNQLHPDHYNNSLENDLWTEISNAYYGLIVPGTRSYLVLGNSGGHEFGIGYKIRGCGGACSVEPSDVYNYYWVWHLDDLIAVKNGQKQSYEIKPYEYGRIELPFEMSPGSDIPNRMIGVDYDFRNDRLFILLGSADKLQSQYEAAPVMLVYNLGLARPQSPVWK